MELAALLAAVGADDPNGYVFGTSKGKRQGATNVRRRILAPVVARANERLAERGAEPISEHLTPHSLRRTFASILYALGEAPPLRDGADGPHQPGARTGDLREGDEPP